MGASGPCLSVTTGVYNSSPTTPATFLRGDTGSAVSVSPRCFVPPIGSTRGERHPCSLPLYSIPNSLSQGPGAPSSLGYHLFLGQCAAPPCGKTGWLRCRGIGVGRIGVFTRLDIAALMLFPGSLFPMRLSSARVATFHRLWVAFFERDPILRTPEVRDRNEHSHLCVSYSGCQFDRPFHGE